MYLFLTLDPCNCWWLHMDLPPSWVQRFHCRKWCDVKSCARDQLVTSWKGSAGIFSTKNSSERSLDSALRYRIHIRPSPIAKLPPNPLLPLFFGPTPKPLSWPKHLGSRVAFYLGTKLHFFRSDVGQSWKRKNFHRLGLMFLPSKRQKSIYGFPHGFYAQNGDFLCVFFFVVVGDVMDQKKSASTKKCQQLQPKIAWEVDYFSRHKKIPTSPGRLPRDDLVRVWATCPPEKVPEMDVAMSKAGE